MRTHRQDIANLTIALLQPRWERAKECIELKSSAVRVLKYFNNILYNVKLF
jgi:hypothetical protein